MDFKDATSKNTSFSLQNNPKNNIKTPRKNSFSYVKTKLDSSKVSLKSDKSFGNSSLISSKIAFKPKLSIKRNQIVDINDLKKYKKKRDRSRRNTNSDIKIPDYKRQYSFPDEKQANLVKSKGYRVIDPSFGDKNEGLRLFTDKNEETNFFSFIANKKISFWRKFLCLLHFFVTLSCIASTGIMFIKKANDCVFKIDILIALFVLWVIYIIFKFGAYSFAY